MSASSPRAALQSAIDLTGGPTAFIKALNERREAAGLDPIGRTNVFTWLNTQVPAPYVPVIEVMTGVRCEELRPDIPWEIVRGAADEVAEGV